ncbi:MAG: ParB N-terminal domain-containing protein [Clostridia bacterium]
MSLAKTLNKGKQKTKIHINDIRENPDNYYDFKQEEISALAHSILEHGQIHNGLVYEETGS